MICPRCNDLRFVFFGTTQRGELIDRQCPDCNPDPHPLRPMLYVRGYAESILLEVKFESRPVGNCFGCGMPPDVCHCL